MKNETKLPSFEGKKVALIGAGVSNMPLIPFIVSLGGEVTLREKKTAEELGDRACEIKSAGACLVCGEGYLENLTEDVIIRSPGIRPDIPEFAAAAKRGALVTCEMELFAEYAPCPVYAVTGSDGKSTTTTILSKLLLPDGDAYLGGNIGEPLFHRVPGMKKTDAAAVERIYDNFNAYYPEHCADLTRPYPGIRELVERLRAAGVKTAVVSNKVDYGVKKLCDLWYPGLFDMALGERPGIPRKPAPDGVLEVLSALGVPAERTVYIGDSDVDIHTARNAGIDCVGVAWGFMGRKKLEALGAEHIVDNTEQLLKFILK